MDLRSEARLLPRIEGSNTWAKHRRSIWNHIMNEPIDDFINWSTIQATMFTGDHAPIERAWEDLKTSKRFIHYKIAMKEKWVGNPPASKLYTKTSANMIRMAYYGMKMERYLNVNLEDVESVFEFGGGYGAFAYFARNLGFKGQYTLYDLPEILLLQKWYLETNGMYDFYFLSKMEQIDVDLFISISAISEAPPEVRDNVFNNLNFRRMFIEFQPQWDGVDNNEYFSQFAKRNLDRWQILSSKITGHYYLIGEKDV